MMTNTPKRLFGKNARNEPIKDMMEYVARKDYLHFFCMGFTVKEDGYYTVHDKMMREAMRTFRTIR